ncbi:MAG: hypothetical protein ABSF38_01335 [Verrucomicrobiota bacterium]|jgi:hypothetical protein
MKTMTLIHEFDLALSKFDHRLPRQGRISAALWRALAGNADFDPRDERLQELGWAYVFARGGLTSAVRCPEGLVFQMAFDVPSGPDTFRLLAVMAPDQQTISFSLFEAPA